MLRRSDGRIRYFRAIVSYACTNFRIAARSAPPHSAAARRAISTVMSVAATNPVGIATRKSKDQAG
jgi:hypothetical protein